MVDSENKSDVVDAESTETEEKNRYLSEAETVAPCKVELKITVPAETIDEELDERYAEIIKTMPFPGFRVGHTPRRLVEKKLAKDVMSDVRENVIGEAFKAAIKSHDLDPISEPDADFESIELNPGEPMTYSATVLVRPAVDIPDYEKITVQAVPAKVEDKAVDEVIENLRRQHSLLEPAPDGKMGEKDAAVLDFVATVGEETLLERENAEYNHPAEFITGLKVPTLKDEILGKGAGDEFSLTETLPETWPNEEQAGQDMVIAFTVRGVKRYVLPEVNEEFAEELDYDSVEELREEVTDQVKRQAEKAAREATDKKIVDALLEAAPIDLPEDVVKEEIGNRVERVKTMLRMRGVGEEELEEKLGEAMTTEKAEVERDFRSGFLLDAIAKKEKIFVTEREINERVAQMAASYNRTPEEMQQYLEQREMLSSIRSSMKEEKVVELLRTKVKIEDAE
jgi:trigger factor